MQPLGSGGLGKVYKGQMQFAMGVTRPCAIKYLHDEHRADPRLLEMFTREAMIGWDLTHDHPNLVTTHGFKVDANGVPYVVMEYVAGPNVGEARLPLAAQFPLIRRVARDALLALRHVHAHGYVHRDVSAANLLISTAGVIKLADFGMARPAQGTHSTSIRGTVVYLAPEVLMGGQASTRSDLYSLGAVLYELLTGDLPHGAGTQAQVFVRMRKGPPMPPSASLPADLSRLVMGLLLTTPDKRLTLDDALALIPTDSPALASDQDVADFAALHVAASDPGTDDADTEDADTNSKSDHRNTRSALRRRAEADQEQPQAESTRGSRLSSWQRLIITLLAMALPLGDCAAQLGADGDREIAITIEPTAPTDTNATSTEIPPPRRPTLPGPSPIADPEPLTDPAPTAPTPGPSPQLVIDGDNTESSIPHIQRERRPKPTHRASSLLSGEAVGASSRVVTAPSTSEEAFTASGSWQ